MDVQRLLIDFIDSEVLVVHPQIPICATEIHGINLIIQSLLGKPPVVDEQVALLLVRIVTIWALPSTPPCAACPTTVVIQRSMRLVRWI